MPEAELANPSGRPGYAVEFEDTFTADRLDPTRWVPYYLPQWSGRAASAARYHLDGRVLRLVIEDDQPPWCPEFDGQVKVSSIQTGIFAGPVGSTTGQHRFRPEARVREAQVARRLYTPLYGLVEVRARFSDDPLTMAALWMIGYEDSPERSAEICVCEVFGRDVEPGRARVGMGLHPFGDARIRDDFEAVELPLDVTDFHVYAVDWAPGTVSFAVDGRQVRRVEQAPDYPMQLMLGIYEFPGPDRPHGSSRPPREFVVDYVRGYGRRG